METSTGMSTALEEDEDSCCKNLPLKINMVCVESRKISINVWCDSQRQDERKGGRSFVRSITVLNRHLNFLVTVEL